MIKLVKGTKENLAIGVNDRLGNLTTLAGTNPTYDVRLRGASSYVHQGLSATFDGMTAFCLIDTSESGYTDGTYEIFLIFNNLPEVPRLGPHLFEIAYA